MILERLPVDRVNLFLRSDALKETLACFLSEPSALHHRIGESGRKEPLAPRIIRHQFVKISAHEGPDIEANQVEQPIACAFWNSDQRTCNRINFLNGVI